MQYTPGDCRRAAISAVTTEADVVAAPGATKKLVVLGLLLSCDAAGDVQLLSKVGMASSVALTGTFELAADTPLVLPPTGLPYFELPANAALRLTAAQAANGSVIYAIADA